MLRASRLPGGENADADCATFDGAGVGECGDGVGGERRRYRQGRDRPDRCLGEPGAHAGHEGRHLPQARHRAGNLRHPRCRRDAAGGDLRFVRRWDRHRDRGCHASVRARRAGARDRGRLCRRRRSILVRTGQFAAPASDRTEKHTMAYSTNGATSHVIALGFVKQLGVKAKPTATGGPPATYTMTMTGQIDIGWAVVPFGLAELREGKIRVIARGPDVPTLRNQTIRVQIVNANALKERKDVMVRFMRAYRESLDWMYSNPLAVKYYAETIKQPESLVVMQRDQYNPKEALSPDRLSDLDQVMADAIEMKFLDAPLTKAQLTELFQIPPPGS